jgi:uncharacterized protein
MDITNNLNIIMQQLQAVIYSPLSRLLILSCSSQIASMIAKLIITAVKAKKISVKTMAQYGGMPSSHTVFITSFVFGIAFEPSYGWNSPFFTFGVIVSSITLIDTIRFRGTVDRINDVLRKVIDNDKKLKESVDLPKSIAHTPAEVIGGIVFALLYTMLFYLLLYNVFPAWANAVPLVVPK